MDNILKNITLNTKKYKYFVITLLIGVCFMVLSIPSSEETVVVSEDVFDVQEVESRLEDILSKIDKVGNVSVMITMESGARNVYAINTEQSTSENADQTDIKKQSEYVLISQSGGMSQPLKIYEIYPQIKGVLVVCEGGAITDVKLEILQALRSLCGVSSEKITISKMKE